MHRGGGGGEELERGEGEAGRTDSQAVDGTESNFDPAMGYTALVPVPRRAVTQAAKPFVPSLGDLRWNAARPFVPERAVGGQVLWAQGGWEQRVAIAAARAPVDTVHLQQACAVPRGASARLDGKVGGCTCSTVPTARPFTQVEG